MAPAAMPSPSARAVISCHSVVMGARLAARRAYGNRGTALESTLRSRRRRQPGRGEAAMMTMPNDARLDDMVRGHQVPARRPGPDLHAFRQCHHRALRPRGRDDRAPRPARLRPVAGPRNARRPPRPGQGHRHGDPDGLLGQRQHLCHQGRHGGGRHLRALQRPLRRALLPPPPKPGRTPNSFNRATSIATSSTRPAPRPITRTATW